MVKEVEYEDEGNWYKGSIEYDSRIEHGQRIYTIKAFLEDKPYGADRSNVTEEFLEHFLDVTEKGLRKALKKKADENNNSVEERLKRKGFSSY